MVTIQFWKKRRRMPLFIDMATGRAGTYIDRENHSDGKMDVLYKPFGFGIMKKPIKISSCNQNALFTIPGELIEDEELRRDGIVVLISAENGRSPIWKDFFQTAFIDRINRLESLLTMEQKKAIGYSVAAARARFGTKEGVKDAAEIMKEAEKMKRREEEMPSGTLFGKPRRPSFVEEEEVD